MKKMHFSSRQSNELIISYLISNGTVQSVVVTGKGAEVSVSMGSFQEWGPLSVRVEVSPEEVRYVIRHDGGIFTTTFFNTHKGGFFLESTESHAGLSLLKKLILSIGDRTRKNVFGDTLKELA